MDYRKGLKKKDGGFGRIVHFFRDDGPNLETNTLAAIVVKVNPDHPSVCNLKVFSSDSSGHDWIIDDVRFSITARDGHWSWPVMLNK